MKKLSVFLMLAAFAMVASVQAADSCCDTAKTVAAKANCSGKSACGAKIAKADFSVKGATLLARR